MIDSETILEIVSRFIETYQPQTIYLFGSYVWGNPTSDSDLDLCIIIKEPNTPQSDRIREGLRALKGIPIPVDLLVFTEEEIASRAKHPSTLIHQVITKGKKLYEAA